jgi:protein-disulfide isomerase
MKNLPLLIGTLVATLALVVGVVFIFSSKNQPQTELVNPNELVLNNPHQRGAAQAKVTIVEFSDFQCPACKAAEPLVQGLVNTYPDKVRLVYKHFPLSSIHPNAQLAAQASEVAATQDKFWEYHDLLFKRQDEWADLEVGEEIKTKLTDYAQELGIDKDMFLEKIDSDRIKSFVLEDLTMGGSLNVKGTPTFYVNGQQVSAPQLLQTVESIINN